MTGPIGIIGAMESEVLGLISKLDDKKSETVGGILFHTGLLCGKRVVVAKCGVGKVFAAMCAQTMIIKYAPRLIVNTGVAGALKIGLECTDVVIADKLVQHDMDTSPIGDPKGLISGINKIYFESCERATEILLSVATVAGIKAVADTVASGDVFVADKAAGAKIRETFGAAACEMEGAAIAQVAFVNNTPFAVIRSISDNADGNSPMSFTAFLEEAVKNSEFLTLRLVESY